MKRTTRILLAFAASMVVASATCADVFVLKSGGEVRGALVATEEVDASRYTIRPYAGGEITLAKSLVARVIDQPPLIEEYETLKGQKPDTVDGHWEVAQWCREKRLKAERMVHLERILELDGEHRQARRLLRYRLVDGVWRTHEEIELSKGKVLVNGAWRFPEDIELEDNREQAAKKRREWFKTLSRWDHWLGSDKAEQAKAYILDVKDPAASDALVSRLKAAKSLKRQKLYAKVLTSIGTKDAVELIVDYSLEHKDPELRDHCLEMIDVYKPAAAFEIYLRTLKGRRSNNREINRAAIGLKSVGNMAAVPALIDKLATTHRVRTGKGSAGGTSATFSQDGNGSQGTGFGTGQPTFKKITFKNEDVLVALIDLSGQDYGYNRKAWYAWYAKYKSENKGPRLNPRRD